MWASDQTVGEEEIQMGLMLLPLISPREIRVIPSPWFVCIVVGVPLWLEGTTNEFNLLGGSCAVPTMGQSVDVCPFSHVLHTITAAGFWMDK